LSAVARDIAARVLWTAPLPSTCKSRNTFRGVARLHVEQQRRPDAIKVLLAGCARMSAPEFRSEVRRLLRDVLALEPLHYQARMDLARSYRAEARRDEALAVLEVLVTHHHGAELRRVRLEMLRARCSWGNAGQRLAADARRADRTLKRRMRCGRITTR
jgi:hypothetical protein